MEHLKAYDIRVSSSNDELEQPSGSYRGTLNLENGSASYEDFILEDLDSYWDDINVRLTVSRMVSDSVVKGMVNAVTEEADERIAKVESELECLRDKLSSSKSLVCKHLGLELVGTKQVEFTVGLPEASISDQKIEQQFQEEVMGIVLQSWIKRLQEEVRVKFKEQRSQNKNWATKLDEKLRDLRQELDSVSKSLLSHEPGKLQTYGSQEGVEEWTHRKVSGNHISPTNSFCEENGASAFEKPDPSKNSTSEIMEAAQLKHMSKDDLITHFQSERTKLKRSHETTVQEITEKYFTLKREYLRDKGSSHLKKDKELDSLRKKIPDIVVKLDDILVENGKLPTVSDDYENVRCLEDRIESLLKENRQLRDLLTNKKKEVKCLSSQVSDTAKKMSHHNLAEMNFLRQINKLEHDMEDAKIETVIMEDICKIVLTESINEHREILEILTINMHETYEIIYGEAVRDFETTSNFMTVKYEENERQSNLESLLLENEKALHLAVKENEKLRQEMTMLSALMEEKEELASEAASSLIKQKDHFEQVLHELNRLKCQTSTQEAVISEKNREMYAVNHRLDEALEQIGVHKVEICKLEQKLKISEKELKEAERQINVFHNVIQEKQTTLSSALKNEREQKKQIESTIMFVQKLSQAMANFEQRVTGKVGENSSRLESLVQQCIALVEQVNALGKKGLFYKQRFEGRCSDLQMAEEEVDLLGDQVDALISLLEKIYIALDHYSPVLRHYTGVMEILKLIKRELYGLDKI